MKPPAIPFEQPLDPSLPDPASVKLIGLGGVGSIVAPYCATFLASLDTNARLVLIDGDSYEPSNTTRMLFRRCGNKAAVTREQLLPRFQESNLTLAAIEEFVTPENVGRLVQAGDIALLAVDNHATRKLVNDHCAALPDVCLISGGNDGRGKDASGTVQRGTYGNVQAYLRRNGHDTTPPLTRHHPEIAQPADRLPADLSCTELLVSSPQILFANLATASALLATFWLVACGALHYSELAFDVADGLMRPIWRLTRPG